MVCQRQPGGNLFFLGGQLNRPVEMIQRVLVLIERGVRIALPNVNRRVVRVQSQHRFGGV